MRLWVWNPWKAHENFAVSDLSAHLQGKRKACWESQAVNYPYKSQQSLKPSNCSLDAPWSWKAAIYYRASIFGLPTLARPPTLPYDDWIARWQIEAWQNQWSIFTLRVPHSGTLSSRWSSGGGKSEVMTRGWEGFATKTIPQGAPLPTEHSKITIVHRIGCSLNLSISYCCLFVFGEYGCGSLSMGKQSIDKLCRMSGDPLLQKARTFGLGSPPPPRQHNRFFQYTVPSHIKSRVAHLGGKVGPRQKARRFVTEGIMAKKAQIQEARPLCMLVEWASILFHTSSIISFAQNLKPLDPSKAHAYHTQKSLKT